MKLLTKANIKKLESNFDKNTEKIRKDQTPIDFSPVVKFFTPWAGATWLFTEMEPGSDILYGLCDLGQGTPELGYVSLEEITSIRGPAGLKVERDKWFDADGKKLSEYAAEASNDGRINA